MTITVTLEDIVFGERESCERCAVAKAITRATGRDCESFHCSFAFIHGDDTGLKPLPQEARDFIHAFDEGLEVSPFSFELPYEVKP